MVATPDRQCTRDCAFMLSAMAPDERRAAIQQIATAVVGYMVERQGLGPHAAIDFTEVFLASVVEQLAAMHGSAELH